MPKCQQSLGMCYVVIKYFVNGQQISLDAHQYFFGDCGCLQMLTDICGCLQGFADKMQYLKISFASSGLARRAERSQKHSDGFGALESSVDAGRFPIYS